MSLRAVMLSLYARAMPDSYRDHYGIYNIFCKQCGRPLAYWETPCPVHPKSDLQVFDEETAALKIEAWRARDKGQISLFGGDSP